MEANLVSFPTSGMPDIYLDTKQMLFNKDLKNEIQTHILLISRSTPFDEYIKQVQQTDDELY